MKKTNEADDEGKPNDWWWRKMMKSLILEKKVEPVFFTVQTRNEEEV